MAGTSRSPNSVGRDLSELMVPERRRASSGHFPDIQPVIQGLEARKTLVQALDVSPSPGVVRMVVLLAVANSPARG
jgi:hypothetical protein